jgi:hypothetical protein
LGPRHRRLRPSVLVTCSAIGLNSEAQVLQRVQRLRLALLPLRTLLLVLMLLLLLLLLPLFRPLTPFVQLERGAVCLLPELPLLLTLLSPERHNALQARTALRTGLGSRVSLGC